MGVYRVGLVGESNYQAAIADVAEGMMAEFEHEPENPHDSRAIRVTVDNDVIGYLPRESWLHRLLLDEGGLVFATIDEVIGAGRPMRGIVLSVATGDDARPALEAYMAQRIRPKAGCLGMAALAIALLVAWPSGMAQAQPDASASRVEQDAATHCANRWPDNFSLRAACVRNARSGAADWRAISQRWQDNATMQRALARCIERHTDQGVTNWFVVGGCARNQEAGARELGN